ncbi:MAG: phosphate ABC transporter permease PstA [Chloroflexi bacterium]|nr:phosphate ABC transporter permease PstA [Chloroflexota bacterium]
MAVLLGAAALAGVIVLALILGYTLARGLPAISPAFFVNPPRPYGEPGSGIGPALIGTLAMTLVAALLALPVALGAAIYLSEYGRGWFAEVVRFVIEQLASAPSIIIGVFIWSWLVIGVMGHFSGLAGAAALGLIMIPIACRTIEEVLRLVPGSLREASLALGVPAWRTVLRVVVPSARTGVITGVVLAMARASGETAPLLMTALGNQYLTLNLLEPMASLPVQVYNYTRAPYEEWHTLAWGTALVLISLTAVLSGIIRWTTRPR